MDTRTGQTAQGRTGQRDDERRSRECLEKLCPPEERSRRIAVAADALTRLDDYRQYLKSLEDGDDATCKGLATQLADRAFEAEAAFRILLCEGLRSVNDLRDSSVLHPALGDLARTLGQDGEKGIDEIVRRGKQAVETSFPGTPTKYFDEAAEMFRRRKLRVDHDGENDALVLTGPHPVTGQSIDARVRLTPRAGDLGRVSVGDFFGGRSGVGIHANVPTLVVPDCHQRPELVQGLANVETIDAYSALVGGMAAGRESMYRHARKVERYGHTKRAIRGNDPVTVIVGIIIAVGVALVIYGLASGDYGVAAFGGVLILGGILVLCCGFILVIGLAA